MSDFTSFKDILKEEMKQRGVTLQQLSEQTDISPRYLRALMDNDTENLPPAPYVRGYLQRIAEALQVDFSMLWDYYAGDLSIRKAGASDILPKNRFAIKPINKLSLVIIGVVIVLLAIFFPSITDFFGKPSLEVTSPASESTLSENDTAILAGRVARPQDSVFINDTSVPVDENGIFSKQVPLSEGANAFDIKVKRFLGQETHVIRTIFYRTQPTFSPSPDASPSPEESPSPSPEESPLL